MGRRSIYVCRAHKDHWRLTIVPPRTKLLKVTRVYTDYKKPLSKRLRTALKLDPWMLPRGATRRIAKETYPFPIPAVQIGHKFVWDRYERT